MAKINTGNVFRLLVEGEEMEIGMQLVFQKDGKGNLYCNLISEKSSPCVREEVTKIIEEMSKKIHADGNCNCLAAFLLSPFFDWRLISAKEENGKRSFYFQKDGK